ncbi:MAG TPA: hypothetical protein VKV23_04100, partial [Acidimicrobiales bacterium]|nr:hypothetical protein [Acidimicrobiales bacterium]
LGVPTAYLAHDKPDAILARLGLDGPGIARAALEALERLGTGRGAGALGAALAARPMVAR